MTRKLTLALVALALLTAATTGCPAEAPPPAKAAKAEPAPEPEPEPEEEPAKPAPAPEPEFVFDRETARTPWVRAEVGDWIKLETPAGTMQFEVSKVEEDKVFFKIFSVEGDELIERREAEVDLAEYEEKYKDPRTYDAVTDMKDVELQVGDKKLKCLYVKREYAGMSTETWFCDEIALNDSVVKSIKDGSTNVLLLDFGSKESK